MKKEQTAFEKIELADKLQSEINCLISKLAATNSPLGDWKIIKCYEYALQCKELPYDLPALMKERQKIRDEVNKLQKQLEELTKDN